MGFQASSGMEAIAVLTAGSIRAVTEKYAPALRQAPVNAAQYSPESALATIVPVHPASRAAPSAAAVNEAAPRAVFALPPRSRVPASTGAACGVLIVAASAFSPRTSTVLPEILVWPNAAPCLLCPY